MILRMTAKCSDAFSATLHLDRHSGANKEYNGYVPKFFPGDQDGDYVEFDIDMDTGKILNWKKPSKKDLEIFK